jgi:hypothetical protein
MWCILLVVFWPWAAPARVVINEIFYHAPDEIEDLEFIELFNSGEDAVDLSGWKFTKGIQFAFASGTRIEGKGFLVLCRNERRFKQYYPAPIAGTFDSRLSNHSKRLELSDARGRVVDTVKYQDIVPWPLGPDGLSGSLERICPESGGDNPANWASSPLSPNRAKPMGSPGQINASYSEVMPPVISKVSASPEQPSAKQTMTIKARVRDAEGVREVKLLYRLAGSGFEQPEVVVPMQETSEENYQAEIPGQEEGKLIRFRVQAVGANGAQRFFPAPTEPCPALSAFVHGPMTKGGNATTIPLGWIINVDAAAFAAAQARSTNEEPRGFPGFGFGPREERANEAHVPGASAFVYFDSTTNQWQVFDFVEVDPRKGGVKVHFSKGQFLQGMSTINLIFEGDAASLAEPLAYEVYRRAGVAAPLSWHVRLVQDNGSPAYQLLVEQINRTFLRRHGAQDDGDLYKLIWYGRDLVGQHEKKTHVRGGHSDLLALNDALTNNKGDALWDVIRTNFDVVQVVNYFAVNTVLSHWDGFFNNYFTYHDGSGTGRWTMYPWDQDQTWGVVNMRSSTVFYDMPLTFGMDGDKPPGSRRDGAEGGGPLSWPPGFGGRGSMWWRPPGYFSGPLLANPQFRKLFLARTKELLETVYTEEQLGPVIDAMSERLRPEVEGRARAKQRDPERAVKSLENNIARLHEHLKKRREFLLAQEEIKNAGTFSDAGLAVPAPKKSAKKAKDRPPTNP